MDLVPIFYIVYKHRLQYSVYCSLQHLLFPHCAINPLFCKTGEIDNLSVSSWAKFWFVYVQIPRCWRHHRQPGTSTFWRLGRSHHQQPFDRSSTPTGPIKPWVDYLRETCCCLHHNLPLGVHQLVAIKHFSGAVGRDLEAIGKGSLSIPISLLCFCSCFSFVLLAVKNQKPKKIKILHLVLIFELSCCLL